MEQLLVEDALVCSSQWGPLAYDSYGTSGPTVVLLHGIPGSRETFRLVAQQLGKSCRVIVPDLLGFGHSKQAPSDFHAKEHANTLMDFISSCGIQKFHLVGFDFGGPTAVHIANRWRDRVISITLSATNIFPDTPIPFVLRLAKIPLIGELFYRLAFGKLGLMAMWLAAVTDRSAFPFSRYKRGLRGEGVQTTRRIFLQSMRDLPGLYSEVAQAAKRLALPSLVLWGDRDPFFSVAVGERTAKALGATFHVMNHCGHFVPEERATETANAVRDLVVHCVQTSRDVVTISNEVRE